VATQGICIWGRYSPGSLGDGNSPVGSRDEVPVEGLRDEVPQKLKQFVETLYRF